MSKFKKGDNVLVKNQEGVFCVESVVQVADMTIYCLKGEDSFGVANENQLSYADKNAETAKRNNNDIRIWKSGDTVIAESCGEKITISLPNDKVNDKEYLRAAKEAFTKLVGVLETPYNDKVVCISSKVPCFVVGKVYLVEDGFLKVGGKAVNEVAFRNASDLLNSFKGVSFIPLVE